MKKQGLSAEGAMIAQSKLFCGLRACASSAPGFWKLTLLAIVAIGIAGCGTKTELLKPDGKPTAHNERDPSQPPSPISR
jgi:hypothetical protein